MQRALASGSAAKLSSPRPVTAVPAKAAHEYTGPVQYQQYSSPREAAPPLFQSVIGDHRHSPVAPAVDRSPRFAAPEPSHHTIPTHIFVDSSTRVKPSRRHKPRYESPPSSSSSPSSSSTSSSDHKPKKASKQLVKPHIVAVDPLIPAACVRRLDLSNYDGLY